MSGSTSIFNQTTLENETTGGGGGGGMAIGDPVTGGTNDWILYINNSGSLFGDNQATRDSGNEKQTDIESNTYAQLSVNDGISESQIQADNVGASGNLITLTFDGIIDVNQAILDWNTANPSNTCSLISGTGTEVIPAGTEALVGGGTTGFQSGAFNVIPIGALQGAGNYGIDVTNNNVAFNVAGNLTTSFGRPTMGVFNGFFSLAGGAYFLSAANGQTQLFASDFSTFQATVQANQFGASIEYNGNTIQVNDFNFALEDSTSRFEIPVGQTPILGDVLTITNVSGSTYTVEFQTPSVSGLPNGTLPFQFWRWDDNAGTQDWDQVFIFTQSNTDPDQNVLIGENAGALTETSYAGYANAIIGNNSAQSLSSGTASEISRNTVVGVNAASSVSLMENSIVLGYQSFSGGTDQIIQSIIMTPDTTGANKAAPITNGIAIGYQAKIHGTNNIVIGQSAAGNISDSAEDSVIVGSAAATSGNNFYRDVAIGANAGTGYTSGGRNTFLGFGTSGPGSVSQSIALGNQAQVNNNNQMTIGGIAGSTPDGAIYDVRFNNGVTDLGGEKYSFKYPDVLTSTTNGAGNEVEFYAGRGTGNAAGSQFLFFTSLPVGSGTSSHSLYRALELDGQVATIGDVTNSNNKNKIIVNDKDQYIYVLTSDVFDVFDNNNTRYLRIDYTNSYAGIGDVDGADNGSYVFVKDADESVELKANETIEITDAVIRGNALHNNALSQGSASEQDIRSGTWTATATNTTNIASITVREGQWLRVGNVVNFSLAVEYTPSGAGATSFEFSLPVASNLTQTYQVSGTSIGVSSGVLDDAAWVNGSVANNTAVHTGTATNTNPHTHYITGTYVVL